MITYDGVLTCMCASHLNTWIGWNKVALWVKTYHLEQTDEMGDGMHSKHMHRQYSHALNVPRFARAIGHAI